MTHHGGFHSSLGARRPRERSQSPRGYGRPGGGVPTGGVGREDTRGHPPWCACSVLQWPATIHAWVSWTSSPGDDKAITWGAWSGRCSAGGKGTEMSHWWQRATNRSSVWKLNAALLKGHYQLCLVAGCILPPYQFRMSPHCSSASSTTCGATVGGGALRRGSCRTTSATRTAPSTTPPSTPF